MFKKPRLRKLFESQHAKGAETLLKSAWKNFNHIFQYFWQILIWKKSLLVICEILGFFINTWNANDNYSLCNRENLLQPIQMQLPKKQKNFFRIFWCVFLKCTSNFEHFEKKDDLHSSCISEVTYCEGRG